MHLLMSVTQKWACKNQTWPEVLRTLEQLFAHLDFVGPTLLWVCWEAA